LYSYPSFFPFLFVFCVPKKKISSPKGKKGDRIESPDETPGERKTAPPRLLAFASRRGGGAVNRSPDQTVQLFFFKMFSQFISHFVVITFF